MMKNTGKKIGRNDPCPCGSGKKYKKCCMNIKLNIQLNQLRKHIKFANTDLSHLKSAVRPLKIIHNRRKENSKIIKKYCPHFKLIDNIGNCQKFKVICKSWECEYLIKCKEACIKNCAAYSKDAKLFKGVPNQLKIALEKCQERIQGIIKTVKPDEIISYLTKNLEICAAEALTVSPSELVSIIRIRHWMHKTYGDLSKYNFLVEVKDKLRCYELWHLIIECLLLEEHISMLEIGDAVFIANSKGQEKLEKIATDPLYEQKDFLRKFSKKYDIKTHMTLNRLISETLGYFEITKYKLAWYFLIDRDVNEIFKYLDNPEGYSTFRDPSIQEFFIDILNSEFGSDLHQKYQVWHRQGLITKIKRIVGKFGINNYTTLKNLLQMKGIDGSLKYFENLDKSDRFDNRC